MVGHHRVLEQVGADVDHPAEATGLHAGQGRLHGVQRAAHAALELCLEGGPTDGGGTVAGITIERERCECVVDHRGDALAEVGQGVLQHRIDLAAISDVGRQCDRLSAQLGGQRPSGAFAVVVVDDDARTLCSERAGDVLAKSASATGDQHQLFADLHEGAAIHCMKGHAA